MDDIFYLSAKNKLFKTIYKQFEIVLNDLNIILVQN